MQLGLIIVFQFIVVENEVVVPEPVVPSAPEKKGKMPGYLLIAGLLVVLVVIIVFALKKKQ